MIRRLSIEDVKNETPIILFNELEYNTEDIIGMGSYGKKNY